MKEKKKDFINLLDDLCYIYKDYTIDNDGSKLDVVIDKNIIKMYLYDSKNMIDEFGLTFLEKEKDKYYYVSIVLMKIDGRGFKIIVNDQDLFNRMFDTVIIHRDMDFYNKIDVNRRVRNKVNRDVNKIKLDERVNISKKLLRTRR